MSLDPRTVVFLIIIGTTLMGGGLLAASVGHLGDVAELPRWARATLLQALGWTVVGALGALLPLVVTIVVGNGLILLSFSLYLAVLASFTARRVSAAWLYVPVTIQSVLLAGLVTADAGLAARNIVLSVCATAVAVTCAHVLLSGGWRLPTSHRFTAGLFALCAVLMTARGVLRRDGEGLP